MASLEEGWALIEAGQYAPAEWHFRQILESATDEQARQAQFGLGYALAYLNRFDDARALYRSLREEARQRGAEGEEHRALHQVGMVERLAGDWHAAQQVFTEEAGLIDALGNPALPVAVNRYEQGILALHLKQFTESRRHLDIALDAAQESGDLIAVGCALRGLGDLAVQVQSAQARRYWLEARSNFAQAGSVQAVRDMDERLQQVDESGA